MQVTKQHLANLLIRTGNAKVVGEALEDLPDPVDFDRAAAILQSYGVTKDALISQMGGSS